MTTTLPDAMKITTLVLSFLCAGAGILFSQPPGVEYDWQKPENGTSNAVFAARRAAVIEQLSTRATLLVFAADVRNRQNDVDYEYRQSSNLLYLTGFPYPGATLAVVPPGTFEDDSNRREVLFVKERDMTKEMWSGVTPGVRLARFAYGIPTLSNTKFGEFMERVLPLVDTVYYAELPTPEVREPFSGRTISLIEEARAYFKEHHPNIYLRSWASKLAVMRESKDSTEQALLRRAVEITMEGFRRVFEATRPGITEAALEAVFEGETKRLGAMEVGYPSIVGAGKNACILHYIENTDTLRAGDLVLMDAGAEYWGYTADITRTFPVSGTFTEEQKLLYNLVLEAQDSAFAECKAGNDWRRPHSAAVSVIRRGLLDLGIISRPEDYRAYFAHGTSHSLGLDVHDANTYRPFSPGVFLTVEPGIYIPAGSPCDPKWWNIGIRIEDNVLITDGQPDIFSLELPRTVEEIEAAMRDK